MAAWASAVVRMWTYPTRPFLVGIARSQLVTAVMLSMYCIFNGLFASSVDSGLFYFFQIPLVLVLFYAIRPALPEADALKLMNVYVAGSMLLTVLSSLYFVILCNHLQISYRECGRIGGPFPALYSTAECARVLRIDKGRIARVIVFVLVQLVCIHPAVSFRIHLARVLKRSPDATAATSALGRRSTASAHRALSGPTAYSPRPPSTH